MFTNNKSGLNKVSSLPPLGRADHDVIFIEVDISAHRSQKPPRKVFLYRKARWRELKEKLTALLQTMRQSGPKYSANDLWNLFKDSLLEGMRHYIQYFQSIDYLG